MQKLLERKQLQIEVGNAVVPKLTLQELLITISEFLKEFIHHDVASVVIYDDQTESLRVHALDKPAPVGVLSEGSPLPIEGTPPGLAIKTRKTVLRDYLDHFHAPALRMAYEAGLRSGCSTLMSRMRWPFVKLNTSRTRLQAKSFTWKKQSSRSLTLQKLSDS